MIKLILMSTKTHFDVAKTLSMSELSESHDEILPIIAKLLDVTIAIITGNTSSKGMQRKMIYNLRKNKLVCIHLIILEKFKEKRELLSRMLSSREHPKEGYL